MIKGLETTVLATTKGERVLWSEVLMKIASASMEYDLFVSVAQQTFFTFFSPCTASRYSRTSDRGFFLGGGQRKLDSAVWQG